MTPEKRSDILAAFHVAYDWAWKIIRPRATGISPAKLRRKWRGEPAELDDALRALRSDGLIALTGGRWVAREFIRQQAREASRVLNPNRK